MIHRNIRTMYQRFTKKIKNQAKKLLKHGMTSAIISFYNFVMSQGQGNVLFNDALNTFYLTVDKMC